MSRPVAELSAAQRVAMLPPSQRAEILADFDLETLQYDWSFWSRPAQYIPMSVTQSRILFLGGRGAGKMLDVATPVPTPTGWTTMGALIAGDWVLDEAGHPCQVTVAHPVERPETAYRLTFSDGTWIDACADHQWLTWTHRERKALLRNTAATDFPEDWPTYRYVYTDRWGNARSEIGPQVRTTQDIVDTLVQGARRDLNHCIPVTGALALPDADLPIDPWLFGYWLGDGGSHEAVLHVGDQDLDWLLERVVGTGEPHWSRFARTAHRVSLTDRVQRHPYDPARADVMLARLGLLDVIKNKHIPQVYLRASVTQRRALLAGLMDSDGYVSADGRMEFTSVNEHLARDVLELVRSLGCIPTLNKGTATLNGVEIGPKYRLLWRDHVNPFSMPRKAARWKAPAAQALRTRHRMIVSAERLVDPPLMRCITVDSPNSMYLAGEAMVPTHNTRGGCEWSRDKARSMPGSRGLLVARTAADVRDVLITGESGILNIHPPSEMPTWEPSKRLLSWPNGSTALVYSAEIPDALRGIQSHWSLADEIATWDPIPDASGLTAWDNLVLATRLGAHPQILAMTTPRRTKVVRDLLAEAEAHPDKVLVRRSRTSDNRGNLSQAYLDAVVAMYEGTALAAQELDGMMLDDVEGALWTPDELDRNRVFALPPASELHRPVIVVGVDPSVAENPRDECGIIVVIGTTEDRLVDRHIYVVEDRSLHASPNVWAEQVALAARKWGAVVVAEVNQGASLIRTTLENVDPGIRVVEVHSRFGKALRAEPVQLASQQGRLHMVGEQPILEEQLCAWIPEVTRKSPDRLDALVHAATAILTADAKRLGTGTLRITSKGRAAAGPRYGTPRGAVARGADGREIDRLPTYMRRSLGSVRWN
jgi:phage terminase large subunit-like protein